MIYKEMAKIAEEAGWTITNAATLYYITKRYEEYENRIVISKFRRKSIYISNEVCMPEDFIVIKAAIKLAETRTKERIPEEKLYLKHRWMR